MAALNLVIRASDRVNTLITTQDHMCHLKFTDDLRIFISHGEDYQYL